jgi:uncharacterized protein (TIGR02217 family)
MSFVEERFPVDISFGATGGPMHSTDIITTFGGREQRNINWSAPLGMWNVAHGAKTQTQLNLLIAFFRARRGKAVGFRFKDWSDYTVTAGNIGTGTGALTTFQLRKQYTSGGATVNRIITKPVAGTILIYKNGVLQVVTTDYTVSTTTGIVTFIVAPALNDVITASFEFDVPARFDIDKMEISIENLGISSWGNVPVIEIRV